MSYTICECDQGSSDWFAFRAGSITASMASECRKRLKSGPNKGDFSSAAHDYAFKLAIERISGEPLQDDQFETYAMRRGHELEPEARLKHEAKIDTLIEHAGYVQTECGKFGCSADGLIDDDGGSEYKCFTSPSKLRPILLSDDFSEVMDQVQFCMWITGRKWWHLVFYCPTLAIIGKELKIHEAKRDDDYIAELERDMLTFDKLVEDYKKQLEESK